MNRPPNRRLNVWAAFLAGLTAIIALITLLGVAPILPVDVSGLGRGLIQIVSVTGALAVLIGVLNLLQVNVRRITRFAIPAGLYSFVTILAFVAVLAVYALEKQGILKLEGSTGVLNLTLLDLLQTTIESALAGLLFFSLLYAAYRMVQRRVTLWTVLFLVSLVLILIGFALPADTLIGAIREWVLRVPVSAGTRGLLIGVAIGTLVVGVRVLIGQDRLFRE